MPRMRNDPNFNVCPDYASDGFANTRAQLISDEVTEEQAIQLLKNIWEANNNVDKVAWQRQVAEDREEHAHRKQLEEEEQERIEQARIQEEEAACKEDRKKNKHKFTPILNTGILDDPATTPCSYALRKIEKGEYVEIWYFTNDGLDEANLKKTVDDDAMIMSTLADSSSAWVSAASTRSARAVVNDEDLPFEEFCQACPRMLTAMGKADWPEDRVRMMAKFWRNIQVHEYQSMRNLIGQKALLAYQAEQRRRWHITVKTSVGPYDLSIVNKKVLQETRERVYWDERDKRDNARNYKVSLIQSMKHKLELITWF
ncbi:hypothetical protein DFJ58DRAFT_672881 [Suillus subalutaceus]|uniref:uncharacterized protein n=1 Tax=Suillus subalutaceus TaxID=48586 RepID=UPI001B88541F|nr:uncharacterized protein DFJ58DRAFT_672881 [Suillus subalutaceus]KAG1824071.1 hypothetical protein DFJ58DRAFT_672881 [Suillus subalutaceus]